MNETLEDNKLYIEEDFLYLCLNNKYFHLKPFTNIINRRFKYGKILEESKTVQDISKYTKFVEYIKANVRFDLTMFIGTFVYFLYNKKNNSVKLVNDFDSVRITEKNFFYFSIETKCREIEDNKYTIKELSEKLDFKEFSSLCKDYNIQYRRN